MYAESLRRSKRISGEAGVQGEVQALVLQVVSAPFRGIVKGGGPREAERHVAGDLGVDILAASANIVAATDLGVASNAFHHP